MNIRYAVRVHKIGGRPPSSPVLACVSNCVNGLGSGSFLCNRFSSAIASALESKVRPDNGPLWKW